MTDLELAEEIEQHKLHLGGYLTEAQWDQIIAALRRGIENYDRYELARTLLQKFGKIGQMETASKIVDFVLDGSRDDAD